MFWRERYTEGMLLSQVAMKRYENICKRDVNFQLLTGDIRRRFHNANRINNQPNWPSLNKEGFVVVGGTSSVYGNNVPNQPDFRNINQNMPSLFSEIETGDKTLQIQNENTEKRSGILQMLTWPEQVITPGSADHYVEIVPLR